MGALLGCVAGVFIADAHNGNFYLWGMGGLLCGLTSMAILGAGQIRFVRLSKKQQRRRNQTHV